MSPVLHHNMKPVKTHRVPFCGYVHLSNVSKPIGWNFKNNDIDKAIHVYPNLYFLYEMYSKPLLMGKKQVLKGMSLQSKENAHSCSQKCILVVFDTVVFQEGSALPRNKSVSAMLVLSSCHLAQEMSFHWHILYLLIFILFTFQKANPHQKILLKQSIKKPGVKKPAFLMAQGCPLMGKKNHLFNMDSKIHYTE